MNWLNWKSYILNEGTRKGFWKRPLLIWWLFFVWVSPICRWTMNHDVSLLPKLAYSRTVQTAQFPIVHMVDWVLCQGVRHATFIPYRFVNWQELWPTSRRISVSCVPTTCPSCWSRGLTALSLELDCHCLASDTRWQFRGFADLVSLSCSLDLLKSRCRGSCHALTHYFRSLFSVPWRPFFAQIRDFLRIDCSRLWSPCFFKLHR